MKKGILDDEYPLSVVALFYLAKPIELAPYLLRFV
jgi:hypothetical protein